MVINKKFPSAFRRGYTNISRVLHVEVGVLPFLGTGVSQQIKKEIFYPAIWDTGATTSVITKRIAAEHNLKPVGKTQVSGVNSVKIVNQYLVNIVLPNRIVVEAVRVTEADSLTGPIELLIGMDIINLGDFCITNLDGKTAFTFQIPSSHNTDYVEETNDRIRKEQAKRNNAASRQEYVKTHKNKKKNK